MTAGALWLFLACAFGAEIIGTMAGFGAATVLTPVASCFFPIKTSVAIVAGFHLCGNAARLWFFRRQVAFRIVGRFGLAGIVASWLGAQAVIWMPGHLIRMAFGAFLLCYVASQLVRLTVLRLPATTSALVAGGIVSGLIAGLLGTGGAIRAVCLLAVGLPKEAYLGTSAAIALLVDATRLPVYLAEGFIPPALGLVLAGLVVVAFCGAWVGQRLVRRISAQRFREWILGLLALMGIKLLIDGLRGIG